MSGALPPAAALARAVRMLEEAGLAVTARNERGDSLYLARPGCSWSLRVSNHARRPRQRRTHPEVLASLVLDRPVGAGQLAGRVEATLRDFGLALARRAADDQSGSRK